MVASEPSTPHAKLPWFIAEPGRTDVLLVAMGVFVVLFVFLVGVFMLRPHHLPEHIAQKEKKVQYH
ncbi:MAG: hypothetical protein E6614_00550 [Bradyrhizobium sp.]|jgi:hypothetical protein|uniref:Uncharacterized protein n=1 Tax=Bradyrhizobium denitrificans TaxID=2734912 RepID=A0ABS5G1Q1_9BRAD|nr:MULTISPECIES: hypothetical protein [Bradyrhizobium]MBR1135245.1 hypothetical protein [Bradyrhizobium denitrificans]MDU0957447.1 hypothetical protein [Bradyrhizobium sp.]MDU1495695.1 hypothetical protein [Bradyrhizobium sp.]MDU1545801.1 hypothetical protein [Bradyrhizobium sp.]MDU1694291.1 hypothetical protein [Bradyrhizobium sp.]